jgi:hypothetical protein
MENETQEHIKAPSSENVTCTTSNLSFLEKINKYSNLIVGIATIFLVIVTAIYISLSWTIAKETKRLADISVEQFKIKAYPVFIVVRNEPTSENGIYKDQIRFENRGELASHQTSFLIIHVLKMEGNKWGFVPDLGYLYDGMENEKVTGLDYSIKVPPKSAYTIRRNRKDPHNIFIKVTNQLVFIKHKVPYDTEFSFESYGYFLKKKVSVNEIERYRWELTTDNDKQFLIQKLFDSEVFVTDELLKEKVAKFFKEYKFKKGLTFKIAESAK